MFYYSFSWPFFRRGTLYSGIDLNCINHFQVYNTLRSQTVYNMVVTQSLVEGRGCAVPSEPKLSGYTLHLGSSLPFPEHLQEMLLHVIHWGSYGDKVLSNAWGPHINKCEPSSFTEGCNLSSKIILTIHSLPIILEMLSLREAISAQCNWLVELIVRSLLCISLHQSFSSSPNGRSSEKHLIINPNTCLHCICCDMDKIYNHDAAQVWQGNTPWAEIRETPHLHLPRLHLSVWLSPNSKSFFFLFEKSGDCIDESLRSLWIH